MGWCRLEWQCSITHADSVVDTTKDSIKESIPDTIEDTIVDTIEVTVVNCRFKIILKHILFSHLV